MKRKPETENIERETAVNHLPQPSWKIVKRATLVLLIVFFTACSSLPLSAPPMKSMPLTAEKGTPPAVPDDVQAAYSSFASASIAVSRGDYQAARKYLSTAIEKDPESAYLCRKMTLLLKKVKDYQRALKYALRCVRLDPDMVSHRILLADIYVLLGDDELALEQYNKALSLDRTNQRVRLLLTTILIRKQQFDAALHHLEVLTEQSPDLVIAHYYRGRINLETGSYREAEAAFQEALRLNESLEPALFDLSTLYQMTERYPYAIETYEKLLRFYPDNFEARKRLVDLYLKLGDEEQAELHTERIREHSKPGEPGRQALGLIYLKQGKLDESIEELDLIVSAWPDDQKSRYYLATAYEEKEDLDKALEHFRKITPDSKYFISAQMHIGYLLERQEQYDEAISVLERAIELEKEKVELYLMLASVYETKEEYREGIKVIREGLKQHKENIDLAFRLGVLLDKSGDKESCLDQMRRIVEIDPNHADSLNYIGYTYADQGIRLDEAMEMIQRALTIKPDSGYIIDSLGWVYYQKGLYDEALNYLLRAAELTEGDPTINEHLGDAYFKKKQLRESLEYYKKALSLEHPDEKRVKQKITEVERLLSIQN